jgi:hypothetical protein
MVRILAPSMHHSVRHVNYLASTTVRNDLTRDSFEHLVGDLCGCLVLGERIWVG